MKLIRRVSRNGDAVVFGTFVPRKPDYGKVDAAAGNRLHEEDSSRLTLNIDSVKPIHGLLGTFLAV
jgi:hypothetical protein